MVDESHHPDAQLEAHGSTAGTLRDFRTVAGLAPRVLDRMAGEFVWVRELVVDGDTDVPEVRGFGDEGAAMAWLQGRDGS